MLGSTVSGTTPVRTVVPAAAAGDIRTVPACVAGTIAPDGPAANDVGVNATGGPAGTRYASDGNASTASRASAPVNIVAVRARTVPSVLCRVGLRSPTAVPPVRIVVPQCRRAPPASPATGKSPPAARHHGAPARWRGTPTNWPQLRHSPRPA